MAKVKTHLEIWGQQHKSLINARGVPVQPEAMQGVPAMTRREHCLARVKHAEK